MMNTMSYNARSILAMLVTGSAAITVRAATAWPTEPGTYRFEDYVSTSATSMDMDYAPTGDQTFTVTAPHDKIGQFWLRPSGDSWVTLTGEAINASGSGGNNNIRLYLGNVRFENAVTFGKSQDYIGYTGHAQLAVGNGGSLTVNAECLRIGQKYNDATPASGVVYLEQGGRITANKSISVGNGRPGALWVEGGKLDVVDSIFYEGDSSEGYIRLDDGEISLRGGDAEASRFGASASYSSMHISGGTLGTKYSGSQDSERYVRFGYGASLAYDLYIDGGLLDLHNRRATFGYWDSGVAGKINLTVADDGKIVTRLPVVGVSGSGTVAINLLAGGVFEVNRGFSTYGNTTCTRYFNFDGGSFRAATYSGNTGGLDLGSMQGVVYPKGGTIEIPSGTSSLYSPLRRAAGWGVKEITLTNPGSGYLTAPQVTISGGSGQNATAYAVLKKDRTLEKVVVTCRGEGYLEDDVLTVSFASTTGSGAAATATLAENTMPKLSVTGAGTLNVASAQPYDGELAVALDGGSFRLDNGSFANVAKAAFGQNTLVRPTRGTTTTLGRYDAEDGLSYIRYEGASDVADMTIGTFTCAPGSLALVDYMDDGLNLVIQNTENVSPSTTSRVLNGMVYSDYAAGSNYRSPSVLEVDADGKVSIATTSSTPGEGVNWLPPTGETTTSFESIDKVNSVTLALTPNTQAYIESDHNVEIQSGMIVFRRPHVSVLRLEVTGGGALTTRAKGGMIYYNDQKETSRRTNGPDEAANWGSTRRMMGPFADPDGSTPMPLTVIGERKSRPEQGVVAWLITGKDTYTGGLRLCNGGVVFRAENALGGSLTADGNCSLANYNASGSSLAMTIDSAPIHLKPKSALILSPSGAVKVGNRIASKLTGSGDLITSDIGRTGWTVAYTGDHSEFEGDYYVMGEARIAPETFSAKAGIRLADSTNGLGVVAASGAFSRPVGTGKGEVCWKRHATMPGTVGLRGGFAAVGGDLAVNLGGEGAALVPGADYLPEGAVIQLQSQYADGELTVENGLDLAGKTQEVSVWTGKTAKWAGELKDSVGGGTLKVTGGAFAFGGTLKAKIGPNGFEGHPVAVDGNLTLDGATVELDATDADLEKLSGRTIPLVSVTGTISGKFERATSNPRWIVRTRAHGVELAERKGLALVIR